MKIAFEERGRCSQETPATLRVLARSSWSPQSPTEEAFWHAAPLSCFPDPLRCAS